MEVIYSEKAQKDREYWKKSGNKAIMNKITALIEDIKYTLLKELESQNN